MLNLAVRKETARGWKVNLSERFISLVTQKVFTLLHIRPVSGCTLLRWLSCNTFYIRILEQSSISFEINVDLCHSWLLPHTWCRYIWLISAVYIVPDNPEWTPWAWRGHTSTAWKDVWVSPSPVYQKTRDGRIWELCNGIRGISRHCTMTSIRLFAWNE